MTISKSSRDSQLLLPPLSERIAAGRPVMTRDQALSLAQRVKQLSTADRTTVEIRHKVQSLTQLSGDRVRSADDGETLSVWFRSSFGDAGSAFMSTNQLTERALRELVARADALGKGMPGTREKLVIRDWDEQDTYAPTPIWQERTVESLQTARETAVSEIINTVRGHQFRTAGFVGVMAKAEAVLTSRGIAAYSDETDCEVSVTARPVDGMSTGWSGAVARDWEKIDPVRIANDAVEMARKNLHPQALEPGRRTAILGPSAVVQLMRFFALHFNGGESDAGTRGFSKVPNLPKGSRWNEQLFDRRIKITTDPSDPEGGCRPWFGLGYASHPTTWVEGGFLKYLSYGVGSLAHAKPYAEMPYGFRFHGGDTTIEQMIAQCDEGVYVNRFSSVDILDWNTGMMTGVTRDGCFFVKRGKIDRPVKNFRWQASPFFVLNNIIAVGPTERTAFGYAPWTDKEKGASGGDGEGEWTDFFDWPRRPMVVPPLMVRDFNFCSLVDAI
jgi:predicted Zn-dependent protease